MRKIKTNVDVRAILARLVHFYLLSLLLLSGIALSQSQYPNAGTMTAELQRKQLQLPEGSRFALPVEDPPRPAFVESEVKFTLMGVSLRGNTIFTTEELVRLIERRFTTQVTLNELIELSNEITYYYRRHGFLLARAYVPAQEIENGVVRIAILEGYIDQVELVNNSALADRAFGAQKLIDKEKPVRSKDLERGVLLLNDLNGVEVSATLAQGERVGTSNLIFQAEPQKRLTGYVELDNSGNNYTGEYRAGGGFMFSSPLGLGDAISFRLLDSGQGLSFGRLSWRIPLTASGLSFNIYRSQMQYAIGGALVDSNVTGDSAISGVGFTYPLIRSLPTNVNLALNIENIALEDSDILKLTEKNNNMVITSITGSTLSQNRVNSWSARLSVGELEIIPDEFDQLTAQKAGAFQKINLSYAELYHFGRGWSVYGSVYGQWANKNLDSSERFALGGPHAVRAYPQGELIGDLGYLITGELRYGFQNGIELSTFIDTGAVQINAKMWDALEGTPGYENNRSLSGIGLGFFWASMKGFSFKANVATPVGATEGSFNGTEIEQKSGDLSAWFQMAQEF